MIAHHTEYDYFQQFSGEPLEASMMWCNLPVDGLMGLKRLAETTNGVSRVEWESMDGHPILRIFYDSCRWTERELETKLKYDMEWDDEAFRVAVARLPPAQPPEQLHPTKLRNRRRLR